MSKEARGICIDCDRDRPLDNYRLCASCAAVSLAAPDSESPNTLDPRMWQTVGGIKVYVGDLEVTP